MEIWVQNLLSGLIGSVLGSVAAVWILIATNRHTSRVALQQRDLERDLARGERELKAVADLLTYLQTRFNKNPMSEARSTEIVGLVNLLILNAPNKVREGWEEVTRNFVKNGRSRRHPLPLALIAWSSADELSAIMPTFEFSDGIRLAVNSGGHRQHSMDDSDQYLMQAMTAAWENAPLMVESISRLSRMMLRWDVLTDNQKIHVFDPLLELGSRRTSEFFAAFHVTLGSKVDGHLPFENPSGPADFLALHEDAASISDFHSKLAFDLMENTAEALDIDIPRDWAQEGECVEFREIPDGGLMLFIGGRGISPEIFFDDSDVSDVNPDYDAQTAYHPDLSIYDYEREDFLAPFATQENEYWTGRAPDKLEEQSDRRTHLSRLSIAGLLSVLTLRARQILAKSKPIA